MKPSSQEQGREEGEEERKLRESATFLKERVGGRKFELAIVCGSGLGGLIDSFDKSHNDTFSSLNVPYEEIPYFPRSTVQGHKGILAFGSIGGRGVVCMVGRLHCYEGHPVSSTVFPIRVLSLLGITSLLVTNASGGLNSSYKVGDFMIIRDHVSFAGMAGMNPLIGRNLDTLGPRFPPMGDAYDFNMRVVAARAGQTLGIMDSLREGVYCFVAGPSFETRAEARFLRDGLKCDCVGMSTVPEVIAAKHCGMKVLGLSLVTNQVGVSVGKSALDFVRDGDVVEVEQKEELASHHEVLETSAAKSVIFTKWVQMIIKDL